MYELHFDRLGFSKILSSDGRRITKNDPHIFVRPSALTGRLIEHATGKSPDQKFQVFSYRVHFELRKLDNGIERYKLPKENHGCP